jgi:hypothetical protein
MQKHEYFNKIKNSIKSLENVKNEIKHLEEKLKKQEDKDKNEKLNHRINFWITLIKDDLSGNSEENISKIVKNESNFIKEITKIETKNKNMKLSNKIKNSSFDETSDQRENNSIMSFRETNIPYINSINMNRKSNNNLFDSKSLHKGIFSKFNYLKQKPHSSSLSKNPRNNSEEYKINQYKEIQEDSDANMDGIIKKDFEETTDLEYRELIEKKSQYLETNLRLEKNIQEIKKRHLKIFKPQNIEMNNSIQKIKLNFIKKISNDKKKEKTDSHKTYNIHDLFKEKLNKSLLKKIKLYQNNKKIFKNLKTILK